MIEVQNKEEQVTLKDLLDTLNNFYKETLKYWYIVILGIIFFGAFFGFKAWQAKPTYTSKLTFMLNEDTGPAMSSALSGLLGRFGGSGGKYNLEKILALSRSRTIIDQTVFSKIKLGSKEDYIANFLIDQYEINKADKSQFKFKSNNSAKFNPTENEKLIALYNLLCGPQAIFNATTNEKSGIMNLELKCINEELAIHFVDSLYVKLSDYYINKSIEKESVTYNLLKRRVETLYGQMNHQMGQAASAEDKSLGVWEVTSRLPQIRYERDAKISAAIYAETLKNLEMADFSLKNKTPFIQLIDAPIAPLEKTQKSILKNVLIGTFLGGFLATLFIILRKIVRIALLRN